MEEFILGLSPFLRIWLGVLIIISAITLFVWYFGIHDDVDDDSDFTNRHRLKVFMLIIFTAFLGMMLIYKNI